MKCYDLEDHLKLGMRLFSVYRSEDEAWSQKVQKDGQFSAEVAKLIRKRYEEWYKPCDAVLKCVQEKEAEFGMVEGAADFKMARVLVKRILAVPIDEVIGAMDRAGSAKFEEI